MVARVVISAIKDGNVKVLTAKNVKYLDQLKMKMNDEPLPIWVYLTGVGLLLFTIVCFVILVLGMIY